VSDPSLRGLTVVGFESRMADATARLVEKFGGHPLPAPSVQAVPLEEHDAVFAFGEALLDGRLDIVYFTTDRGTRLVFETLDTTYDLDAVRAALAETVVTTRSPKPAGALSDHDVPVDLKVPEPHTGEAALDAWASDPRTAPLDGARIAIHEYGRPNDDMNDALRGAGTDLLRVPVYRWTLPDDRQPLENGIRALIGGEAQVALFTSRQQVDHVLRVAADRGWVRALRTALGHALVASVGPVTTEALETNDIAVDYEPDRSKLAILIRGVAEYAPTYFQPA
jgi:uroporphyrinogen-III synthase